MNNNNDDKRISLAIKAIRDCNLGIVKELINDGLDVDSRDNSEKSLIKEQTLLMIAAKEGHLEIVCYLITKDASLELRDELNNTALILAAQADLYDICEILLEEGVNVYAKNNLFEDAMHFAAFSFNVNNMPNQDIVDLLLEYGYKCNIKSKSTI